MTSGGDEGATGSAEADSESVLDQEHTIRTGNHCGDDLPEEQHFSQQPLVSAPPHEVRHHHAALSPVNLWRDRIPATVELLQH
jgi:hypothetical protein